MGILGLIGLLFAVGGFSVMSKTSRILLVILLGGSLYYWQSISAVFHGGNGPDLGELKIAMTLLSANIGGFVLGSVLGVAKRSSTSEIHYQERKKAIFTFLVKWGIIYAIYSFVGGKVIDLISGEDGMGWLFMRVWGIYGFVALIIIWLVLKTTSKNRSRVKS